MTVYFEFNNLAVVQIKNGLFEKKDGHNVGSR